MSRSRSPILLLAALTAGVTLGIVLDRGAPYLSAQATSSPRPAPPAAPPSANAPAASGSSVPAKATSDEGLYDQLDRQYEQFQQINRTFELVARTVSPSVVHIVAHKTSRTEDGPRVRHFEETGSGVIVRSERAAGLYVLTNNHVIEGSPLAKISIFLQDGRALHPIWFRADAKADIAVLSLGRDDLPAARIGNSNEAVVGSWVLALGSPFGLMHSVSQGIISAKGRHMDELQDVENQDFLQTDAAINPGNSGGPLVNMRGEVIGINNSIASNGGGNEGVGFSIPINLARWIMGQLVTNGRVSRGALGIDLHPEFRPEDAAHLGLEKPRGAWVNVVYPASPAAAGGLHDDDVILKFNGVDIHDLNHLINMVSMAPIGQPADIVIWRERKTFPLKVTVGDRDRTIAQGPTIERNTSSGLLRRPNRPEAPAASAFGLELTTLDKDLARQLGLPNSLHGAVVMKIAPESPLATKLMPLDVIASVGGRLIGSSEEAIRSMNRPLEKQQALVLEFDRLGKSGIERRSVRVP